VDSIEPTPPQLAGIADTLGLTRKLAHRIYAIFGYFPHTELRAFPSLEKVGVLSMGSFFNEKYTERAVQLCSGIMEMEVMFEKRLRL
jgi:hypothetical protein